MKNKNNDNKIKNNGTFSDYVAQFNQKEDHENIEHEKVLKDESKISRHNKRS